MRKEVEWGRFIRAKNPLDQIREVIHFFGLNLQEKALQRCLECNGILHEVPKAQVAPMLAPKTLIYDENFSQCDRCGKVYWEGSHYSKMVESFDKLL